MARRFRYHITQRPDGNWQVKKEGANRASAVTPTKAEIMDRGRDLARAQANSQLVIHKANGRIQAEHTYGADPHPPKG